MVFSSLNFVHLSCECCFSNFSVLILSTLLFGLFKNTNYKTLICNFFYPPSTVLFFFIHIVSYHSSYTKTLVYVLHSERKTSFYSLIQQCPKSEEEENLFPKECHPLCVYQNYNGLIINNGSQKHNYICKYNNLPTTCFGLIRPSSGWNTVSEENYLSDLNAGVQGRGRDLVYKYGVSG